MGAVMRGLSFSSLIILVMVGTGLGSKSDVPYYFVEATAHYDGSSMIGMNPWYDLQNHGFYDVE